ncbi:MAG TPA: PEP/pyruvate-binding domain-containing protein [Chthoniobacterales bacterium]
MPTTLEVQIAPPIRGAAKATLIKWFADLGIEDVPLVGGKNASLGEMVRALRDKGVQVPNGFAITAEAYRYFLGETGLDQRIDQILTGLDTISRSFLSINSPKASR